LQKKPEHVTTVLDAKELFSSFINQVDNSVIQPDSLFKTLTTGVIPSEKTQSVKRQKLTSNIAIDKGAQI